MNNRLAPIVLLVYNRPEHTRKTLEALSNNNLAAASKLFIYADGPKINATEDELNAIKETREVLKEQKWCGDVVIIESEVNKGLAKSIVHGVTEIVEKFGTVIVLEDDIVTSSGFLQYMNDALDHYSKNEHVMHISGYMYPHNENLQDTFFYNVTLCWGWATWKSSWSYYNNDAVYLWKEICNNNLFNKLNKFGGNYLSTQLGQNITGQLDTWFIKWHASVLLNNGFTLFPNKSLVDNIGFDSSGVHNGTSNQFHNNSLLTSLKINEIAISENDNGANVIVNFYNSLNTNDTSGLKKNWSVKRIIKNKLKKLIFKFIPNLRYSNNSQDSWVNSYKGKNTKLYSKFRISNSIINDYTYVAENAIISNTFIGKFCSIGPNLISGWGIHPTNGISSHPMFYSTMKQNGMTLSPVNKINERLNIEIGNDVFIGMNVTILDGVKIGNGAIIGAGAVVSKDIPPYAIAVGTPIRIIKYRFDNETIKSLLKIKWWEFNLEELKNIENHIFNLDGFLDKYNKMDQ
jgi:acetyltransferase-like isoleucine patch superfamily enzyme/GR25 family glycosyltransferase involved in LPS biosynthesis